MDPKQPALKPTFGRQLAALLRKHWLIKLRGPGHTSLELLLPLFFVGVVAILRVLNVPAEYAAKQFQAESLGRRLSNVGFFAIYSNENDNFTRSLTRGLAHVGFTNYSMIGKKEDIDSHRESKHVKVVLVVEEASESRFQYKLRIPQKLFRQKDFDTGEDCWKQPERCFADVFVHSGVPSLQALIELCAVFPDSCGSRSDQLWVQKMPKSRFISKSIEFLQQSSAFYFVLAFTPIICRLIILVVTEKETRVRETLQAMGMSYTAYWLSWVLTYFVMVLLIAFLMTAVTFASQLFVKCNFGLFFLLLLLYGMACVTFALIFTPFFQRGLTAGICGVLTSLVFALLYLALQLNRKVTKEGVDYGLSDGVLYVCCIASPLALAIAMDKIWMLEVLSEGATFSNAAEGSFPLLVPYVALVVDIALYLLIYLYLDKVFPSSIGRRHVPWFLCSPSFWRTSAGREGLPSVPLLSSESVESIPPSLCSRVALQLRGVQKTYSGGKVTALRGVDLDLFEGEIFCLLGHNGAGKSTLIHILTGLHTADKGSLKVLGYDLSSTSDLHAVRGKTGFCPQHDVLWNDLTPLDHLHVMGLIKGMSWAVAKAHATSMLHELDLSSKSGSRAGTLSGGQKRKLSLAMALTGDPKLLILDEPTAGMDPLSRRHVWSVLQKARRGRVLLLCTHFMDEADVLADRKAIMSAGKVQCAGTSLWLKERFGAGYHLHVTVEGETSMPAIADMVHSHIPSAQMEQKTASVASFALNREHVEALRAVMEVIENDRHSLHVLSYGVSMSGLEDVFMKVVHQSAQKPDSPADPADVSVVVKRFSVAETLRREELVEGRALRDQQFWGMVHIRLLQMFRNKFVLFMRLLLPIAFIAAGLYLADGSDVVAETSKSLDPSLYISTRNGSNQRPPLFFYGDNDDSLSLIPPFKNRSFDVAYLRTPLTPNVSVAPFFIGIQTTDYPFGNVTLLYNDSAIYSVPVGITTLTRFLKPGFTIDATLQSLPGGASEKEFNRGLLRSVVLFGFGIEIVSATFGCEMVLDRQTQIRGQLRLSGLPTRVYLLSFFFFDVIQYLLTVSVSLVLALTVFDISPLKPAGAKVALSVMLYTCTPTNIFTSYVASFFFKEYNTSLGVMPILLAFIGFLPNLIVTYLDMLSSTDLGIVLHYVFCVIDPCTIHFGGFYFIDKLFRSKYPQEPSIRDYFLPENHILFPIIMEVVWLVALILLWLGLDSRGRCCKPCQACRQNTPDRVDPNAQVEPGVSISSRRRDSDVVREKDRSQQFLNNMKTGITSIPAPVAVAVSVHKEFSSMKAVNDFNLVVMPAQIIGLLGPNGAGKTTAMSMITGLVAPSDGTIIVGGQDVSRNTSLAQRNVGYCPQFDALWDSITLSEHISIYGLIRGVPKRLLPSLTDMFVAGLNMTDHISKHASRLSGGTRRKLSYSLSMLAAPPVILLDEPSTGMDPVSKRYFWKVITHNITTSKHQGAIITTHSMEEADAICTKIAIMTKGELRCLGDRHRLIDKYSRSYIILLKHSADAAHLDDSEPYDNVKARLVESFPGAVEEERFHGMQRFRVPLAQCRLAHMFRVMENVKHDLSLEQYSVSQVSLEQLFLDFANDIIPTQLEMDIAEDIAETHF